MKKVNKQLIYGVAILCWMLQFQSCDLFETQIVEDRSSFVKIYNSKNQISVDYLAKIHDGFLLFSSEDVTGIGIEGSAVKKVSEWGILEAEYNFNALDSFTKVLAIDKGTGGFVYLGKRDKQDFIMRSTTFSTLTPDKYFGIPPEENAVDFDVLPNGNIVVLSNKGDSLAVDYFDPNLNLIWNRVYSIKNTEGQSIKYDQTDNSFFILGFNREGSSANLFVLKINDEGNELNIRFGSEFFDLQNDLPLLTNNEKGQYNPRLLDLGTHFIIIDRGENYTYPNGGAKFQAYFMSKSMETMRKLNTVLDLSTIGTAQVLDNEILISGTSNNNGIIRKLDADGQAKNWDNGTSEVVFETNITSIINALNSPGDERTFNITPTFIPGNIVKNDGGGYSMLGTYGIFNQDEFEQIMTLFRIRADGSY